MNNNQKHVRNHQPVTDAQLGHPFLGGQQLPELQGMRPAAGNPRGFHALHQGKQQVSLHIRRSRGLQLTSKAAKKCEDLMAEGQTAQKRWEAKEELQPTFYISLYRIPKLGVTKNW